MAAVPPAPAKDAVIAGAAIRKGPRWTDAGAYKSVTVTARMITSGTANSARLDRVSPPMRVRSGETRISLAYTRYLRNADPDRGTVAGALRRRRRP
ncbi:hypothetical protein GCM10009680_53210 [Streptomyces yatensis]|uniref:Uncharacterized protein n=1 Tax=Streptomyces yatensis TaxID=155177 RepID=A0ABN2IIP2_9ACTN